MEAFEIEQLLVTPLLKHTKLFPGETVESHSWLHLVIKYVNQFNVFVAQFNKSNYYILYIM